MAAPRPIKVTLHADVSDYLRGMRRARRAIRRQAVLDWWHRHGYILAAGLTVGLAVGVNVGIFLAIAR